MPNLIDIVRWSAIALLALTVLAVVALLVVRGVRTHLSRTMTRRLARVETILAEHRSHGFDEVDRLLFELGQVDDAAAVEQALGEVLREEDGDVRPRLRQVYDTLGLTERYVRDVEHAAGWADRAAAAKALGLLAAVSAIPALLRAMRAEHEDDAVKQAAARALSLMKADEAIPHLVDALGKADDWASPRLAELLVSFEKRARPALVEALNDEERTNARVWAAQILGRGGDRSVSPALLARLQDRAERVRLSATEALGRLQDRAAVGELTRLALRDPVPTVRAEAARALGQIGDDSVLGELRLLLSVDDYWTRLRAVEAIEKLAPEDTFPLEQALGDESRIVRAEAARALERLGVLERWMTDLEAPDQELADLAERRLVQYGRAGSVESLLTCADHDSLRVRARICTVLAAVGDPGGVETVTRLLDDPMWPVRVRAVEALASLRPTGVADHLVPRLSDDEEMVRVAAVVGLQGIGASDVEGRLDALRELYRHGNAEARCSVIDSVENVPVDDVADLIDAALGDPNPDVRVHALQLAERRPSPRWESRLIERLADAEPAVRNAAARAIAVAPDTIALEAIAECLNTTDLELREILTDTLARQGPAAVRRAIDSADPLERGLALAMALGKTGDPEVLDDLKRLAADERIELRVAAAEAIGRIAAGSAGSALEDLLKDPSAEVRSAAVEACGRVGSEASIEGLRSLTRDPDAAVRARVAVALGRIGGDEARAALLPLLDGADPKIEPSVVLGLGLLGDADSREQVLERLRDEVTRRDIERLLTVSGPEVAARFRGHLALDGTCDDEGLAPDELAERYLRELRHSRDETRRLQAIRSLRVLSTPALAEHLMEALTSDPAESIRVEAVAGLVPLLRDGQVAVAVRRALSDPAPDVQRAAVDALGQAGDPSNNDALLRCSALSEPDVARSIVTALARANEGRVAEFTDELMGYAHERVQIIAAGVLGRIGDADGQRLLSRFALSDSAELRSAALRALGRLGTMKAIEAIAEGATDPREEVRAAAAEALVGLPLRSAKPTLDRLMKDPSQRVRAVLAVRLGDSDDALAIDLLDALAGDPAEPVRVRSLVALIGLATAASLERFADCLARQTEPVRVELRRAVRDTPAEAAVRRLVVEHRQAETRRLALDTLATLGADLDEVLAATLRDPAVEVRLAAIRILADRPGRIDHGALDGLLDDPEAAVREAARKARLRLVRSSGD